MREAKNKSDSTEVGPLSFPFLFAAKGLSVLSENGRRYDWVFWGCFCCSKPPCLRGGSVTTKMDGDFPTVPGGILLRNHPVCTDPRSSYGRFGFAVAFWLSPARVYKAVCAGVRIFVFGRLHRSQLLARMLVGKLAAWKQLLGLIL